METPFKNKEKTVKRICKCGNCHKGFEYENKIDSLGFSVWCSHCGYHMRVYKFREDNGK